LQTPWSVVNKETAISSFDPAKSVGTTTPRKVTRHCIDQLFQADDMEKKTRFFVTCAPQRIPAKFPFQQPIMHEPEMPDKFDFSYLFIL
jgi:hypothetical protein